MDRQKIEKLGTFVLGGVAGAVTGILISPRSGRELRSAVSSRAGEARERGREGYFEARERAWERLSGLREPGPADGPEVHVGEGPLGEPESGDRDYAEGVPGETPETPGTPGNLRLVPEDHTETSGSSGETSDALRLRIRQTRERLRGRRPGSGGDG